MICMTISTTAFVGLTNTAASLAYSDRRRRAAVRSRRGDSKPSSVTLFRTYCSELIAMMKRYGDSGSPYRRPRRCLIQGPLTPFNRTEEDVVEKSRSSQLHHFGEKPLCCSRSIKYSQDSESKAFDM
jgi:hypothetical protein